MSGSESGIYVEPDSGSDRCLKSQSGSTATTERTQQAVFFYTMCDPLGELAKATPHSEGSKPKLRLANMGLEPQALMRPS